MKLFVIRHFYSKNELNAFGINVVGHHLKKPVQYKSEYDSFAEDFLDQKPDIFYFHKDEQLTREFLQRLKRGSPKTKFVMCYWDQRGGIPPLIGSRRGLLDAILINNEDPKQFKMYKAFGIKQVFTLHHGIPPNEFQEFDVPVNYDVFFGGNNFNHKKFPLSKFRYDLIMRIKKLNNSVVYGNGWPFKTEKRVPRHIYAKVLRSAKTNIGTNHYDIQCYFDRRLFECMASGRVHITRYVPGMEKYFEHGKNIMWFRTIPQALNAITNMLRYPEKRELIAKNGRNLMLKEHSFDVRTVQLRDILFKIC